MADIVELGPHHVGVSTAGPILDFSGLGAALFSSSGELRHINRAMLELLRIDGDDHPRSITELFTHDSAAMLLAAFDDPAADGEASRAQELELVCADGTVLAVEGRLTIAEFNGERVGCLLDVRAATKGRALDRALDENRAHHRTIFEASAVALSLVSSEKSPIVRNRAFAELFGRELDEFQYLDLNELIAPHDEQRLREWRAEFARSEVPLSPPLLDFLKPDGTVFTLESRFTPVEADGELIGYVADHRDVTAERAAAEELHRSNTRLRATLDASPLGIAFIGESGATSFRNRAYAELLGYSPEELQEMPFDQLATPAGWKVLAQELRAGWRHRGGARAPVVIQMVRSSGETIDVEARVAHVQIDEHVAGRMIIFRDVTAELASTRLLAESEAQLRRGQAFAHVGTWNIDVATGQHQWTGEVYRLFGLEPGSVEPSNEVLQRYMNPDDRARLVEAVRAAELGDGRCEVQVRTVGADGIARTLWIRSEIVRDDQGRACRWEGATQDVTDLVRAQESLAERERFLRSTLEAIQSGILVLDASPDARIISANKQASEIFGYSPAELVGRRTADLVIEEQRRLIEERREARLGGELGIAGFQLRGRRKDGALIDLESRGAPLVHKGELEGVVVDVRDVTDEVALQREVQSNAERLNTVFETVSTGLLVIGADLRPITANRSACEILGYDQVELMEKTVADLGDPVGAKMLVDEVTKRIQRGSKMSFLQAKIRRGDGIWIDAELTVEPFRVDGSLVGALCEIRDVTEKRAAERELRQLNSDAEARSRERQALVQQLLTAQEEERRTVAYDIHDGPAQQLAAAQMFLETYAHEADVDLESDAAEHLRRAKLYLETGLGETRRIMSGLRPSQLDDLGLVDAIGQLLAELTAGAAVECEFKATRLSAVIPAEVEITLFRIVQEAIGNALKYSGTDRVEVDLSAGAETVKLHVRDWGSGFDPSAIEGPRDGRRYGLVGMRERVALLGGRFTIDSRRGEGTTISAEIPLG